MVNYSRRDFLGTVGLTVGLFAGVNLLKAETVKGRLNVLLITADDMSCDSVGVYGCAVKGTTPNIDRFASEGLRFSNAHVNIAVCQPCRGTIATGRYSHRSGVIGFNHINADFPTLFTEMQGVGYLCGILGKVGHSTPDVSFKWDMERDQKELGQGRDPKAYYNYVKEFICKAADAGKPFFLEANSHDPHRPFAGSDQEKKMRKKSVLQDPSKTFTTDEVTVPGFLPDIAPVRKEIAEYYSSVRRCDDTVGAVLKALKETGQESNTMVIFLSDHGMALPFAKTNCYLHSTHTPWIVRLPGVTGAGKVCDELIATIDVMPTVLEAAGMGAVKGVDGRSFLPLLRGEKQDGRDSVFTQFFVTSGKRQYPMRCVQNQRFGYIYNPCSDGKFVFKNESQSGRTFKAMQEAAKTDSYIASRVKLFQYRVEEEFYDFGNDSDALHNLINDADSQDAIDEMRFELLAWMKQTDDPVLGRFEALVKKKNAD